MSEWLFIIVSIPAIWFWVESMHVREIATAAVKQFCTYQGLQLLDDAVAFTSIRIERNHRGKLSLHRTYRFEFSDSGANRLTGSVVMIGKQPGPMHVEAFNAE